MSDDLKTAKTALAKLHQDMDAINRLARPSYLKVIEQMERAMEPIRRQQLEISRALEMSGAAARIQEIASANQHWQELIKQASTTSRIAESLSAAHQSWIERIKPIQYDISHFSQLQASAKLDLCDTSLRLAATERLMAGINFEAIRSRFQIEMPVISGLESSIAHVTASYGSLAESLREISDITRLPAFVLPGATREIYTTSFAIEALCTWDEREDDEAETEIQLVAEAELETSGCIALLQQVEPGLARPYIGARDALYGNNADRARHILSSLRELWNHLLRRLAPDDLVAAWIPGVPNQKDLLHEGKPTRRARVLYVCRELNNDPLTDFLMHDTRALVKLIELFNRVHELESELTDEQLRAILLKTDSWLMYILQISMGNFQK
jgi:predicted  nucleic acid-binding Zn-ribbon protein